MNMEKIWKITVERYERMDDLYDKLTMLEKECSYLNVYTDGIRDTISVVKEEIKNIQRHALQIVVGDC